MASTVFVWCGYRIVRFFVLLGSLAGVLPPLHAVQHDGPLERPLSAAPVLAGRYDFDEARSSGTPFHPFFMGRMQNRNK